MSAPTQVRSLDRLAKTGSLIIPGRLDAPLAADLVSTLKGRTITWLAEESTALSQDLQNYLQTSGLDGASFSKVDPALTDVGAYLEGKLEGNGVRPPPANRKKASARRRRTPRRNANGALPGVAR